ncbi:MAG TPA: hypothetical protein VH835_05095 [Dongiaceae bacterium]
MKRLHPNRCHAALAVGLLLATGVCGCRNPQMASTNPFLAPDRVPPPATRTIAPGTAQPYYPGDPLPTSQSAPAAGAPVIAKTQAEAAPANGNSPLAAAVQPLAFSNERSVSIPTDNQDLRFALPPPPAEEPKLVPQVAAAPAPASPITPAAFNQPMETPPAPAASGGPWREPQIPQSGTAVIPAQFVQPQPQPATMAPSMPAELRAVPSPGAAPTEPAPVPPPRMRFPSFSSWFSPPSTPPPGQQLIGYMVPGANGTSQFVPIEQMQQAAAGQPQPSPSVANSDGFRPRGSTR